MDSVNVCLDLSGKALAKVILMQKDSDEGPYDVLYRALLFYSAAYDLSADAKEISLRKHSYGAGYRWERSHFRD